MTPEGAVKAKIKAWLKSIGAWFFMPVSNGMGTHGIPDIICCLNGKLVAIEVKAPGKLHTVTPLQQMQIDAINAAGGTAFAADSLNMVQGILAGRLAA